LASEPEKYRFRIILSDLNQNKKGIYLESYEEAEKVRAYLVWRYNKTTINAPVFATLKYQLLETYMEGFVQKIKHKNRVKKIKASKPK
jgi:hypothetical protein